MPKGTSYKRRTNERNNKVKGSGFGEDYELLPRPSSAAALSRDRTNPPSRLRPSSAAASFHPSLYAHTPLQRSYLISCTSNPATTPIHPDPLLLSSLAHSSVVLDVELYVKEDYDAVADFLKRKEVGGKVESITVSWGGIRGNSIKMRKIGWEVGDIPRSGSRGGHESPTKVSGQFFSSSATHIRSPFAINILSILFHTLF